MFGNKGMSFTLEAVIAGLMIVTFMLFLFKAPNMEETYDIGMSERGYYCLKSLDEDGLLREDAMDNSYTNIENNIQDCLAGLNYTIQICRDSCSTAFIPENQTTTVSNYFIAGDVSPDPLKVKLSMWLE